MTTRETTSIATTSTVPAAVDQPSTDAVPDLAILLSGEEWLVPAAACLRDAGEEAVVAAAVAEEAEIAVRVVRQISSGWPTTTIADAETAEERNAEMRRSGVVALALAGLLGERPTLVAGWAAFERDYADEALGYGAVTQISRRLEAWTLDADLLAEAIGQVCSGG